MVVTMFGVYEARAEGRKITKSATSRTSVGRPNGCCQSNANQSPKHLKLRRSRRQLTPFGQRGGAIFFEGFAAVEMTFEIEMIVDRSMN